MEDDGAEEVALEALPDPYPLVEAQSNDVTWRACYRHQAIVVRLKVVETGAWN